MTAEEKVIDVNSLNVYYGEKQIIKNVSFHCYKGEIIGMFGISGAGKTTIIRVLTCQIPDYKGFVKCFGYEPKKNPNKIISQIGYVPQLEMLNLYYEFTAMKNVEIFASMYLIPKQEANKRVQRYFEMLELPKDVWDSKAKFLSGGEKKRVSIAIGLINQPHILFLDEPTTGVDASRRYDILNYLKKLNMEMKTTMVIVTHDLETANICDRIVLLRNGQVVDFDTPKNLISKLPSQGKIARLRIPGLTTEILGRIAEIGAVIYILRVGKDEIELYIDRIEENLEHIVNKLFEMGIAISSLTRDTASFRRFFQIRMQDIASKEKYKIIQAMD
ncbi:MAG TPA: ABC transporter ATP-binding protein [Candidatus Deferrimicrobium sp.]|nr:ABC transporter ATP-binding protein [Candidatus Deferrimicrobium sp.]